MSETVNAMCAREACPDTQYAMVRQLKISNIIFDIFTIAYQLPTLISNAEGTPTSLLHNVALFRIDTARFGYSCKTPRVPRLRDVSPLSVSSDDAWREGV